MSSSWNGVYRLVNASSAHGCWNTTTKLSGQQHTVISMPCDNRVMPTPMLTLNFLAFLV